MIELLQKDMVELPGVFHFAGPLAEDELNAWLQKSDLNVPDDLKQLWLQTGGGDLFETETILSPTGLNEMGDDVESVNQIHHLRGLSGDWIIFHTGLGGLSAVAQSTGTFASLDDESYRVRQTFDSIDDWYSKLIRSEYAVKYGLSKIP